MKVRVPELNYLEFQAKTVINVQDHKSVLIMIVLQLIILSKVKYKYSSIFSGTSIKSFRNPSWREKLHQHQSRIAHFYVTRHDTDDDS